MPAPAVTEISRVPPSTQAAREQSAREPMGAAPRAPLAAALPASGAAAAAAQESEATVPAGAPAGMLNLDAMRAAAVAALEGAGQNTAATLLNAGEWSETAKTVRVAVAAKAKMFSLAMSPEAEKLVRAAVRPFAGIPPKPVEWAPGEGGTSAKAAPRPTPTGSVEALALENPLVRQAKELFGGEVRSVVDLRKMREQGTGDRGQ